MVAAATRAPSGAQGPTTAQPHQQERPPLKVCVAGVLQKPAEVRNGVDGSAHLVVQVLQPGDAMAFVAIEHVKADGADDLRDRALFMKQGSVVMVLGTGLFLGTHEGNAVLQLRQVRTVRRVAYAAVYTVHDQGATS